ncbi:MAG: NifU family protein [Polyangiaceae bacterium]
MRGLRAGARVLRSKDVSSSREALLRVIRDVIAPLILADQGELYLVQATDERVSLHLAGRYSGCPGNTLARRRVIEPALHAIAPGTEVIVTSGALIPADAERLA